MISLSQQGRAELATRLRAVADEISADWTDAISDALVVEMIRVAAALTREAFAHAAETVDDSIAEIDSAEALDMLYGSTPDELDALANDFAQAFVLDGPQAPR